jgi:WhiB family transcriptional regulator, redox-sensing transcriptional regulator
MTTMDDALQFDVLQVPVLNERPWGVFAACKEATNVSFFPQTKDEERAALAICSICPVQDECLDHAIESKERYGIWGGLNEKDRRKMTAGAVR